MRSGEKQEWVKWIAETFAEREAVAFTLNFRQRISAPQRGWLTNEIAAKTLRRYYRGLCRQVFGSRAASKAGTSARLLFAAVKEGVPYRQDRTGTQLHYHGIIEVPAGMQSDAWIDTCKQAWQDLPWADRTENDFKSYRDSGYVHYILKNRTKEDWLESPDLDTMWTSTAIARPMRQTKLPFSSN